MQRTLSVLCFGLLSAAFLSGCPEKKAEKETPTAEDPAVADQAGAAEDKKDDKADEKSADKKNDEGGEEKEEEGGW
jgi:hypothetical protein